MEVFNSSNSYLVVFEFSQLVILLHNVLTVRGLDSKCFLVECRWGVLIYSSAHGVCKSVKNYTPYMLLQYWWYGFVCTAVLCFFVGCTRLKGGWLKAFLGNWDFFIVRSVVGRVCDPWPRQNFMLRTSSAARPLPNSGEK